MKGVWVAALGVLVIAIAFASSAYIDTHVLLNASDASDAYQGWDESVSILAWTGLIAFVGGCIMALFGED